MVANEQTGGGAEDLDPRNCDYVISSSVSSLIKTNSHQYSRSRYVHQINSRATLVDAPGLERNIQHTKPLACRMQGRTTRAPILGPARTSSDLRASFGGVLDHDQVNKPGEASKSL